MHRAGPKQMVLWDRLGAALQLVSRRIQRWLLPAGFRSLLGRSQGDEGAHDEESDEGESGHGDAIFELGLLGSNNEESLRGLQNSLEVLSSIFIFAFRPHFSSRKATDSFPLMQSSNVQSEYRDMQIQPCSTEWVCCLSAFGGEFREKF